MYLKISLKCSAFSPVWNTADFPRSFAASAECFNLIAMITNSFSNIFHAFKDADIYHDVPNSLSADTWYSDQRELRRGMDIYREKKDENFKQKISFLIPHFRHLRWLSLLYLLYMCMCRFKTFCYISGKECPSTWPVCWVWTWWPTLWDSVTPFFIRYTCTYTSTD